MILGLSAFWIADINPPGLSAIAVMILLIVVCLFPAKPLQAEIVQFLADALGGRLTLK